jgi:hypothetical protein
MPRILKVRNKGLTPLVIQSPRGVNRLDPLVQKLAALTAMTKRPDEIEMEIQRIKYELALYYDDQLGPYIPAEMPEANIYATARMEKAGTKAERAMQVATIKIPILYDGPRKLEDLLATPLFHDVRSVVKSRRRVMEDRPIFPEWHLSYELMLEENLLNLDQAKRFIVNGGDLGYGNMRPRYGRFTATVN